MESVRRDRISSVSFGENRGSELAMHPTVKPVAMVADAIRDCSTRRGIVLDSFAGSGTTLLAALRTGRREFVMEYEPKSVDVTIQRFEELIGEAASRRFPAGSRIGRQIRSDARRIEPNRPAAAHSKQRHCVKRLWDARCLAGRCRLVEARAILSRRHTEPLAEDDPHSIRRTEAAVIRNSFKRAIAPLEQHAGGIDPGALHELVRRDPRFLHEVAGEIARAHPNFRRERLERVSASNVGHHIVLDACNRRSWIGRRGEIRARA